ncbi:hypothetical protein [Sinosporangium siamense]|uniref:Uncharacterized protein n=1 Tax=Sinosporangium siamense TaxID=1367973 RepID=A0A919RFI0_9ACTN|nr:hypothetical protein [Sinosporangium siamense]GII90941.1 hypothetical protein Ssi02_11720 [Sinosporangium siamense]
MLFGVKKIGLRIAGWAVVVVMLSGWTAGPVPPEPSPEAPTDPSEESLYIPDRSYAGLSVQPVQGRAGAQVTLTVDLRCVVVDDGEKYFRKVTVYRHDRPGSDGTSLFETNGDGATHSVFIPDDATGTVEFRAACSSGTATSEVRRATYTVPPMSLRLERTRARPGETVGFHVSGIACPDDAVTVELAGREFRGTADDSATATIDVPVPDAPGKTTAEAWCTNDQTRTTEQIPFTIDPPESPETTPPTRTAGPGGELKPSISSRPSQTATPSPPAPSKTPPSSTAPSKTPPPQEKIKRGNPTLRLEPPAAQRGKRVKIVLSGFPKDCVYSATLAGKKVKLARKRFTVPRDLEFGEHTVTVTCVSATGTLGAASTGTLGAAGYRHVAAVDIVKSAKLSVLADEPENMAFPRLLESGLARFLVALLSTVFITTFFLWARFLALGRGLFPRDMAALGLPADIFNKALQSMRRTGDMVPRHPWMQFLGGVAVAAGLQAWASPDARKDGVWTVENFLLLFCAFTVAVALATLTYSGVAHAREIQGSGLSFGGFGVLWQGFLIGGLMGLLSWWGSLNPSYVYGLIGFFAVAGYKPPLARTLAGIRDGALATYAVAIVSCVIWVTQAGDSIFLKTTTFVILEAAVFALLPIPLLDGALLLQNRPGQWLALFVPGVLLWLTLSLWKADVPWVQLAKMLGVLAVVAVFTYGLWTEARRREAVPAGAP